MKKPTSNTKYEYLLFGIAIGIVLSQSSDHVFVFRRSHDLRAILGTVVEQQQQQQQQNVSTTTTTAAVSVQRKEEEETPVIISTNCTAKSFSNYTGKPIWIPAYPGSGSEMLRAIVKHATGLGGDDIYNGKKCFGAATCKTHWPSISNFRKRFEPKNWVDTHANAYFVLVRNPASALPSLFNYKWESRNKAKSHSVQAPERDWIEWRDKYFDNEMENWKNMLLQWREQPYKRAGFLIYEQLTDSKTGPGIFQRVVAEMESNGVQQIADPACHWHNVVKGKNTETKRAPHKYKPGYTQLQKQAFLDMLSALQTETDDEELGQLAQLYAQSIQETLPVQLESANNVTAM